MIVGWSVLLLSGISYGGESLRSHVFHRVRLTDVYYSEGIATGDINGDGQLDVVYGPYWFAGPNWQEKHEIFPAEAQPRQAYANHFFAWTFDFNQDGRLDVLTVGFPGKPAYVYENPGAAGWDQHWPRHEVLPEVSHEAPQFLDVDQDGQPDLLCSQGGRYGYASFTRGDGFRPWRFHAISARPAPRPFGHGLGLGDVNGDRRPDVLIKSGWFEQPAKSGAEWSFHPFEFARAGGAEMHVMDVDGDGDGDVITSLEAHAYGLAWFEQIRTDGAITFRRHLIMGRTPDESAYGVVFTEPHSVQLADIDGDGLKDIVTGKTYWSHHTKSPLWDAGAVVYWFKLVRGPGGVEFVPFLADDDAGIGRQVVVADVNADGLPDILTGGMKGAHVLLHEVKAVDAITYDRIHPRRHEPMRSGLSGPEAARAMSVPPGFHVALAAAEPQVHQPIACAFDERGRLWVAEAYTYPQRAPEGKGKDRIVILEDTNGDGALDSRKVFIEGLNLVSGMEVGFGGVWVGAAPYLLFIPDRDRDDHPDSDPQVLLDGFGFHDTHETLNAFIWGPDGWLYGCHGVFTHSRVGKPGTPDEDRIPLNAGIWRYHPVRHQFEVFAWGTSNPWGVDFNDLGDAFCTACVIPHLFHVIPGARYQRQAGRHFNPYVYEDIKTIADHAHYAGRIQDHAWWGHEPTELAPDTSAAGGGHAHCGAMIYLGGSFPPAYRNQIFMNNIHGNRVNMDMPVAKGSGYVGRHGPDFLLANDHWFRGINLKYGPDGSVLLIDWYDKNACHRRNPEIWDRTNGRVYRVWYGEWQPVKVDLAAMSDSELVEQLTSKNEWYVRMARRILQDRAARQSLSADAVVQLRGLVRQSWDDVPRLLRAVWTLAAIGQWNAELAKELTAHPDPSVVSWAIRLTVQEGEVDSTTLQMWRDLASRHASPKVRLALASALQRTELQARWEIVRNLLSHPEDASDANLPMMIWYAAEPLVADDPQRAMELAMHGEIPQVSRWIVRRAAEESSLTSAVIAVLSRIDRDGDRKWILESILESFAGRADLKPPAEWERAYESLMQSKDDDVRELAERVAVAFGDHRIFPRLRRKVLDARLPEKQRRDALSILLAGRDPDLADTLVALLDDAAFRRDAIRGLAAYVDAPIAQELVRRYPSLSTREKQDAVLTLTAKPTSSRVLIQAMQRGTIPRSDVHAFHVRQILSHNESDLREELARVWGKLSESSEEKRALIAAYRRKLRPAVLARADVGNGRRIFERTCASCHTLFGSGGQVGPDLTGSNRANLDYLLENIVDPSAVLGKDYRMTLFRLEDGRVVSGLIQSESDSAVTVRTLNETVVIPKSQIEARKLSELSMMPEKLLEPLSDEEVRDLVAYLGSPVQVPLKGPRAPIDAQTGRVPGAMEGESMRIVKTTGGAARRQEMQAFAKDRWSGNAQLWWRDGKPGDRLVLQLPVEHDGVYALQVVLTRARDYGTIQLRLDDQALGGAIDLFNAPDVITTGVLEYEGLQMSQGMHTLTLEIVGRNPKAVPAFMAGLDFVKLVPQTSDSPATDSRP